MKERVFLDTNVLVYLFDADDPTKQRRAQELLSDQELQAQLILSTQVLQEFYVAVTRKLAIPLDPDAAFKAVQDLAVFPVVQVDTPLILLAIRRSDKAKISFWDALIVESALVAGATVLYSEDFQNGAVFGRVRVRNPFRVST
ncbi:MAG: PIN domain-containing protein [Nitrospira sp.]|nr:PIN domain-containing protein [Nitrospira sp.]